MGPASFPLRLRSGAHHLLDRARPDGPRRLTPREARVGAAAAAGYLAVAGLLLLVPSSRALHLGVAAILVVAYAVASRIRLHVGAGYARPTQLVLLPMLFDLPAPAVPALAAAGLVLAALADAARGTADRDRVTADLVQGWHVVAAGLVVLWAGEPAAGTGAIPLVLVILVAQCGVDAAVLAARARVGGPAAPRLHAGVIGLIFVIELLLAPVGLLAAAAGPREPVALLAILALLVLLGAAAIERRGRIDEAAARLDALREERTRLERALRRVGDAFASGLDRDALVELALQTALEALRADRAIAILPGGRTGCGAPADPAASRALVGAVAAARRTHRTSTCEAAGHVAMAHPLERHGVLCVARTAPAFGEEEQELFGHLCRQAVVAIENVELHDRLRRQATEDELTGLANHRRFQEVLTDEVARAGRTGQPLALVMLDIDDFKAINDTHGHQRGDAVLQAVGAAVRGVCRSTDEPARYGGEELAVVLPATDLEGAYVLAEELRSAVARLHVLPDGAGPVTVSAGVATLEPGAVGPGDLIAAADGALYDAKRSGKNRTVRARRAAGVRRPPSRAASTRRAAAHDPAAGPFRGLPPRAEVEADVEPAAGTREPDPLRSGRL